MIEVVAAYLEKDGKILIAKRTYGDPGAANRWEFPGGKINDGESETEALKRELEEEMNIEVEVGDFIAEHTQEYPTRTIHLRLYKCKYLSGELKINGEHLDYAFVEETELLNYDLVPADRSLLLNIKK